MIGKTLAHYEILAELGHGGMGAVYRARDTRLDREVALKILPQEMAADPQRRARFEREARAIAALNHPNVITIHAVEAAEGLHFLAMELIVGKTLSDVIPAGGLPTPRLLELAVPLADAVAAAHAKGITHRDLKPANVMLDADGRLRVLDFGLAKQSEDSAAAANDATVAFDDQITREGFIMGTSAYMSPEQAEGKAVDARSDVFSLGILLYEMATGERPFQGDSHISTLTAILRDDPRPVLEIKPDLPPQLGPIVQRCLEKDPQRRYDSALELRNELERLRAGVTLETAVHPAVTASPSRSSSKAPWAVAAALVAAIALAWWLRPGGEETSPGVAGGEGAIPPSVVVFPFENLGPPEDAYFAAGMTDEITSRLALVDGLSVMSRRGALQYDRSGKTTEQIAEDLGVNYLLEGTVRWEKRGDGPSRVRVTPQLIRASDDSNIWANAYEREMEEIFRVQTEVAEAVAQQLGVTLVQSTHQSISNVPTENMDAYHAYLKGCGIVRGVNFGQDSWHQGTEMLEQAVQMDPNFHMAYAELARSHAGFCHFDWDRSEERLTKAKAAADRALELAPDNLNTHIARGYYFYWGRKDYDQALAAFGRAEALRPNHDEVVAAIGFIRRRQGRFEEALDYLRRAVDLSPQLARNAFNLAETLAITRRYEEAELAFERAIALSPDSERPYGAAAWNALLAGDIEAAQSVIDRAPATTNPEFTFIRFKIQFNQRNYEKALEIAKSLPADLDSQFDVLCGPLTEAQVYRAMGENEQAHTALVRARDVLERKLTAHPEDANAQSALGLTLAGLGDFDAAIRLGEAGQKTFPATIDAWIRQFRTYDLARIYALAGRKDEATELLRNMLGGASDVVSQPLLKMTPELDALRDHAPFQELVDGQT